MKIAIFLFDQFTALDFVGPYEVLTKLPGAQILLVGTEKKAYSDHTGLKIPVKHSIDEIDQADILLIPGGFGIDKVLSDKRVLEWVRHINETTTWTVSVCSGALLLAQAGLLTEKTCTTHWRRKDQLRKFPLTVVDERYIQDGKFITSAGVSAGIDMALYLVSKVAGDQAARMIQLAIEYDPKPPFDCGSPEKAPEEILQKLSR